MKKKIFIVITALVLVAALCGILAACSNTDDEVFRGGVLILTDTNGRFGAVNEKGEEIIPFSFSFIMPFVGDYTLASYDGNFEDGMDVFFIDKEGNIAEGPSVTYTGETDPSYTQGYIAVQDKFTGFMGIMDMNELAWSLRPIYDSVEINGSAAIAAIGPVKEIYKCDGTFITSADYVTASRDYLLAYTLNEEEEYKDGVQIISLADGSVVADVQNVNYVGALNGYTSLGYTVETADSAGSVTRITRFAGSDHEFKATDGVGESVTYVWNNTVYVTTAGSDGASSSAPYDIYGTQIIPAGYEGEPQTVWTVSNMDNQTIRSVLRVGWSDGVGGYTYRYVDSLSAKEISLPQGATFDSCELIDDDENGNLYCYTSNALYSLVTESDGVYTAEVKELLLDFNFIDVESISGGRYMTYTDMQGNHLMDLATREDLLTVGLSGGAEYIAPGYAMSMELAEHSSGISTVFTVYKLEDGSLSEMFTLNDIIGLGLLGII